MNMNKMPKNYMICECGCEFEIDDGEHIIGYRYEPKRGYELNDYGKATNTFFYVICPNCKSKLDIHNAIETPNRLTIANK